MKRLHQLQNRQAAILKTLGDLSDRLAAEDRDHTEEELSTQNRLKAELESLGPKIADEEKIQNQIKALANQPGTTIPVMTPENHQLSAPVQKPDSIVIPRGAKPKHFEDRLSAYKAGQWISATLFRNQKSQLWCKEHGVEQLAHSEGTNTAGGYLVLPEFETAIINLRETYGTFRRNARVRPMMTDTLSIPRLVSGLTTYFIGEGGTPTDSSKVWDQVKLVAKKLACLSYWSNELGDDSFISIADDLAQEMAYQFALKEDQCGWVGDGTSTYGGMVGATVKINDGNHAGSIYTAASGNTAFSTLDREDFLGCIGKLPRYAHPRAKWYISAAGYAASAGALSYAAGGNDTSNLSGGLTQTFMGYPVEFVQVMNSTLTTQANTIVALFGDLGLAASMGDRKGLSIAVSDQVNFTSDQMVIRGISRFDINVHDVGDGSTAGPLVALKTPGS